MIYKTEIKVISFIKKERVIDLHNKIWKKYNWSKVSDQIQSDWHGVYRGIIGSQYFQNITQENAAEIYFRMKKFIEKHDIQIE